MLAVVFGSLLTASLLSSVQFPGRDPVRGETTLAWSARQRAWSARHRAGAR